MGSNAITTIIGEHLLIRNGKSSPSRAITGEYPVYGSNGIIGYSDEYNANENTIIIGRVGSYCGSVYISGKKCWVTDNAIIGTAKNENESHFWFYLLKKIDLNNYSTGSGQPLINQTIINTISVTIPKLSEKRVSIGHFLRHFDQKINLSLNINQSLEQMSQTLFKSWFVDFDPVIDNALDAGNPIPEALQSRAELRQKVRSSADFKPLPVEIRSLFPSEFEETELGWVPKGWNISLAGEEFIVKGGSTPSTANEDFWINGTIHWTSPKDLTGNQSKVLLDTAKKITPLGLTKISSGLLPVNTVLMSSRAPIGYLAISKVPMAINQGYIAIPSAKHLSPEYTIYWLDNIMDDIKGMAGGTTFAEISKSAFKTIKLLIPSSDIITEFSRITRNHFDMVVQNTKEIDSLTNLRDTLLPKLISGELSLEDLPDLSTDTEAA
ncbi:restriction endonuclease subunit S [Escherichia coli]|uniref:restriction endonuclease subunit S n=10 Tax=Escherichia coli TaxID=562 RepID=UPI000928A639|nr:restriction endonuclease subunit S [Escherichia coli]EFA4474105.1 restriction endonuclease subunit S [Escherichia coli]EFA4564366.1 restriction endonuclease subunit S [Escherichia coli]EFA4569186.1 restriction endonuclease subunit S [Escherichia coli]EHL7909376.1 restriction endonuclease subunit S [Escherichia coli]EHZ8260139.1 restriction endonuclease subunit S [Escherichia coli]